VKLKPFVRTSHVINGVIASLCWLVMSGCALFPETRFRDSLHNPFPQIKRVAVLPFYNQSGDPTVNGDKVAEAYYAALQAIPGFEVLPVGVSKAHWYQFASAYGEPHDGVSFQHLAQSLGVDALVVGSVTDFEMHYPPRLAMTVHWYTANEGFHPIPAGYGLPWGTEAEKQIPRRIVREAEFELARSQLATQSPVTAIEKNSTKPANDPPLPPSIRELPGNETKSAVRQTADVQWIDPPEPEPEPEPDAWTALGNQHPSDMPIDAIVYESIEAPLPAAWPNPTDLIPDPPMPHPAPLVVNRDPVLSHTRIYHGNDPYFTKRLSDHVETGDDARPGGWQGYLKRSDDFTRFCCHLHITEMLESRGGMDQSDLILRWPLSRY